MKEDQSEGVVEEQKQRSKGEDMLLFEGGRAQEPKNAGYFYNWKRQHVVFSPVTLSFEF
jgi:hypothetical protein